MADRFEQTFRKMRFSTYSPYTKHLCIFSQNASAYTVGDLFDSSVSPIILALASSITSSVTYASRIKLTSLRYESTVPFFCRWCKLDFSAMHTFRVPAVGRFLKKCNSPKQLCKVPFSYHKIVEMQTKKHYSPALLARVLDRAEYQKLLILNASDRQIYIRLTGYHLSRCRATFFKCRPTKTRP